MASNLQKRDGLQPGNSWYESLEDLNALQRTKLFQSCRTMDSAVVNHPAEYCRKPAQRVFSRTPNLLDLQGVSNGGPLVV